MTTRARRALRDDEVQRMLDAMGGKMNSERNKCLFRVMLLTGFRYDCVCNLRDLVRVSEVLSLRVKDVWDSVGKTVRKIFTVSAENMKGGKKKSKKDIIEELKNEIAKLKGEEVKEQCPPAKKQKTSKAQARSIPISDELAGYFKFLCEKRHPDRPLFPSVYDPEKSISRKHVWAILKDAAKDAKLDEPELVSPHTTVCESKLFCLCLFVPAEKDVCTSRTRTEWKGSVENAESIASQISG